MTKAKPIETDLSLVLKKPQHYHVTVFAYEAVTPEGNFQQSTEFNLVCNDVPLAVGRAKAVSGREKTHVRTVTQCAEPAHLEGIG